LFFKKSLPSRPRPPFSCFRPDVWSLTTHKSCLCCTTVFRLEPSTLATLFTSKTQANGRYRQVVVQWSICSVVWLVKGVNDRALHAFSNKTWCSVLAHVLFLVRKYHVARKDVVNMGILISRKKTWKSDGNCCLPCPTPSRARYNGPRKARPLSPFWRPERAGDCPSGATCNCSPPLIEEKVSYSSFP
jgi:hypothetical protein